MDLPSRGRRGSLSGSGTPCHAGLANYSLHGLRKAPARRLAEKGATNAEGPVVTGHKTDKMFNHYSAMANRKQLADSAFAKLKGG
jgi:hypothetical protein